MKARSILNYKMITSENLEDGMFKSIFAFFSQILLKVLFPTNITLIFFLQTVLNFLRLDLSVQRFSLLVLHPQYVVLARSKNT